MNFQPTPSQLEALKRRAKFRHSIEQRAAALKPAPPIPEIRVVPPKPAPRKELSRSEIEANIQASLEAIASGKLEKLRRQMLSAFGVITKLQMIIAHHYDVGKNDLKSQRRNKDIVYARQMGMFLARDFTTLSYPEIGRRFGGRDHTTVLHAFRKFDRILKLADGLSHGMVRAEQCARLRADVAMFRARLQAELPGLQAPDDFTHVVRAA